MRPPAVVVVLCFCLRHQWQFSSFSQNHRTFDISPSSSSLKCSCVCLVFYWIAFCVSKYAYILAKRAPARARGLARLRFSALRASPAETRLTVYRRLLIASRPLLHKSIFCANGKSIFEVNVLWNEKIRGFSGAKMCSWSHGMRKDFQKTC